jgi:hypothetical protein
MSHFNTLLQLSTPKACTTLGCASELGYLSLTQLAQQSSPESQTPLGLSSSGQQNQLQFFGFKKELPKQVVCRIMALPDTMTSIRWISIHDDYQDEAQVDPSITPETFL